MKIKIYTITLLLSAVLGSCSSSFLDEKPLDFMSATNSFLTQEDIDCSVKSLTNSYRRNPVLMRKITLSPVRSIG